MKTPRGFFSLVQKWNDLLLFFLDKENCLILTTLFNIIIIFFSGPMVETMTTAGVNLEAAGAAIMRRSTGSEIGGYLIICGKQLEISSNQILQLSTDGSNGQISSQRMAYAAQKMMEAGTELIGTPKQKPTGKGWLKG